MIIATAGHVDHGKTALVKQLTGIDADRLEEEKRRGLSINLGFAYQEVGEGLTLGFVDVPGHSRFINTMIAGVNGIDLGMLVVAADDGVMPQTREHLDVLHLLGIRDFVAVITKADRVEASRLDEVAAEVRGLPGLEACEAVFRVSNHSGEGIEKLRQQLSRLAREHAARDPAGNFRLWVDRAFLLKGTGLVLTGTAIAGSVSVGDELRLLPAGHVLRVRSLHLDNTPAERGQAGRRCALNVTGQIDRDKVARGDMLSADQQAPVTDRIDVSMELLDNAPFPIRHLSPLTLHIGTLRLRARLYLLDDSPKKQLAPGEQSLAQLILEQPLSCCRGDRFLVRDDSESATLGGGMVLDPFAPRSGKARADRLHHLHAMSMASPLDAFQSLLENHRTPINMDRFLAAWNCTPTESQAIVQGAAARYFDSDGARYAISRARWQQLNQIFLSAVQDWHQANPGELGIRATALQVQLQNLAPGTLFRSVLSDLLHNGNLVLADGLVRTPEHAPRLSTAEEERWNRLASCLESHGLQLPLLSELASACGLDRQQLQQDMQYAARRGRLIKLNENRYALPQQTQALSAIIKELADRDGRITITTFKESIKSGRKLAIEILEYFDSIRFTQRRAEHRIVLGRHLPASPDTG